MQKECIACHSVFTVNDADLAFYDKVSPVLNGKKYAIPAPTMCPECRQRRRLSMCNELNLFAAQCDLCSKDVISQFQPGHPFPVYCRDCWHGDQWDPRSYGRDIDFNRSFFEQFSDLQSVVCRNTFESYDCEDVEDGKHCYQTVLGAKNVRDIYQYGTNLQESYECTICGEDSYHILFSFGIHIGSSDLTYCWYMESCKDCFGCTFMHHQRYCILNKQYTKSEYEALVSRIIDHMRSTGEWGEHFSMKNSLFGYNLTTAQIYYPLTKEEALSHGALWSSYEAPPPSVKKIIPADRLPDSIDAIPDDVLNWAISCEITDKPFLIQKAELAFYRKMRLPLPRRHWQQRHLDRFHMRNPRKLWKRECGKCAKEMETTYAPDRPEVVYCESCYLKAVY